MSKEDLNEIVSDSIVASSTESEQKKSRSGEKLEGHWGKLKVTARSKDTSASIFLLGKYPAPTQALLEFTDNSVGYRNRDREYATVINVVIDRPRDRIEVIDFGGLGADAKGIEFFALVGETSLMGIGYHGAGAKYAAWYLGMHLEIRAMKQGDTVQHTTAIKGFGDPKVEFDFPFYISARGTDETSGKGLFDISVRGLKDPEKLPGAADLRKVFGEVYRPLLTKRVVNVANIGPLEKRELIGISGDIITTDDKVVLFVNTRGKREQVMLLAIPLLSQYSEEKIQIVETKEKEKLWYWAGEMDVKNKDSKNVESGIRFYYDGRLIMVDYCGFDKRDPRLSGLTGEVHLDNVKEIKTQLTVNKSAGINVQSEQWKRILGTMHEALLPLVTELERKPIPLSEKLPLFVEETLREVRKLVDLSLNKMALEGVYISSEDLLLLKGETRGQRPRQEDQGKEPSQPHLPGRGGKTWGEQDGETVPDLGAQEIIRRVRKSYIDRFVTRALADPTEICVLIPEKEGERTVRVMVLNTSNPLVDAAIRQGGLATTIIIGLGSCRCAAKDFSTTREDFLKFEAELLRQFGEFLHSTEAYRRLEALQIKEQFQPKKKGEKRK